VAYASVADIKRVLQLTDDDDVRDNQLRASLDAVESWVEPKLRHLGREGAQIEVYFDTPEDATLHLPADDCVVTKVKVFETASAQGIALSPTELGLSLGYDLTDDGRLILRPSLLVTPFEGASGSRYLHTYARVEVHYIGSGVIPRAVTEAVAILAAGHWRFGPNILSGLNSEKIGDYSYTMEKPDAQSGETTYQVAAGTFLKPFLRKMRVSVT
jgi:hypothetical protein